VWVASVATIPVACAGTVTITAPDDGSNVTSPVTVKAGVDLTTCNFRFNRLEVYVNGTLTYKGNGDCSISAPVSVPQSADTIDVKAIAWNGVLMAQSTITVTVRQSGTVPVGQSGNGSQLYVSTTGSDANPGAYAAPFQTIGKASQMASPGTTVYVEPGTYVGDVHVTASGVTYKSTVKWGANLVPPASSSTETGFWNDRAANVTIDGFLIDGGTNIGQWRAGIYCDATNCTIRNNKVLNIATAPPGSSNPNGAAGIEIDGYHGDTGGFILNNVVGNVGLPNPRYNLRHCIYLGAYGTTVQNNVIFGCHEGYGIESWHGASHLNISNNLIFHSVRGVQIGSGNVTGVMYKGGNDYTMVFNNIVFDGDGSSTSPVGVSEDFNITTGGSIGMHNQYSNNCVLVAGAWHLSVNRHENDVNGTPTFVNYQPDGSGDYHLVDGSYCTDQGIASLGGQPAPATDFDSVVRPVGPAYDIGPYERTNTLRSPTTAPSRGSIIGKP
jgi:hypothetical protein